MSTKKIIFIHLLNDYSGSPKVLSQVIKSIKEERNYEITLYTGKSKDGFLSGLIDNHYHYLYKRFENRYLTLITFMVSQITLFFKLLKYRNDNVVFYVNTILPFGAGLAGRVINKPVLYHIHETSIQPLRFKKFLRNIVQSSAKKVIFVSNSVKESESFYKIPQEIIYNSLSLDFIDIATKSNYLPIRDKYFNVLMVCSLKKYKGVDEYITIATQCQKYKYINFRLILNAEQPEIDDYFNKQKLPTNLTLITRQKDLIQFYTETSLLLNLSRVDQWIETFGLTILEAMAFGIPVIVPPVGGPIEIVSEEEDGYLISSYETDKIATIIHELSINHNKCLKLSKNAREKSKEFTYLNFKKNIINSISSI
jgi:glycosyltransferase involved in cell wall biosynthesis